MKAARIYIYENIEDAMDSFGMQACEYLSIPLNAELHLIIGVYPFE